MINLQASGRLFLCGLFLISAATSRAHIAGDEMAAAGDKFLASLDGDQRAKASFEFKSDERQNWHFIPKERKGLTVKEMTEAQRKLAFGLLRSGMSGMGYSKATNIMSLENVLHELEGANRKFPRDPELYHFFVFGKPSMTEAWGWRVEGHHLSVNITVDKDQVISVTPSFMGTNPAEVKSGPRKGVRVLADEEDLGRQLVKSLNEDQRKTAIFSETAPKEIYTEAKKHVNPLENAGIVAGKLDSKQKAVLVKLIRNYVGRYRPDVAAADMKKIEAAGIEKVQFAWAGGLEKGQGHYYRVQGPTFLLEYDNTQNDNNHIHAVWRDFKEDFGEDLLRKHYQETPHP
ncbi:MAG TPA: DUF3500 domain-containing protein [Candidatus Saccharimonadales bacterium]|nr:DUF3500 domain-containing protein [Candidatus Saccharimonadales bacterium]